jgi:predicted TPR repeat methyltransferase
MTGMDVSAPMLNKAKTLSLEEGVPCRYMQGDIAKFTTPQKFDFATAINDCINYLPKEKLISAFKCVKNALKKEGIFLFDVSSIRKFEDKIANTVSVDDRESITYLSFNQKSGDKVQMDVSLFVKEEDGRYVRYEETHLQYAHQVEEVISALQEAGFTLLEVEGYLGEDIKKADRIYFLAQK